MHKKNSWRMHKYRLRKRSNKNNSSNYLWQATANKKKHYLAWAPAPYTQAPAATPSPFGSSSSSQRASRAMNYNKNNKNTKSKVTRVWQKALWFALNLHSYTEHVVAVHICCCTRFFPEMRICGRRNDVITATIRRYPDTLFIWCKENQW